MAETRRVASSLLSPGRPRVACRPRLPHPPPRFEAPPRLPHHDTEILGPPVHREIPAPPQHEELAPLLPAEEPRVGRARGSTAPHFPPRTRTEQMLMTVLLLGLGLTALILVTNRALTRSDFLLGSTVLAAGVALLVLMEICRRTCPPRR